jgi:hypothetical protein
MKVKVVKEKQEALRDLKTGIDLIRTPVAAEKVQVNKTTAQKAKVDDTMRD